MLSIRMTGSRRASLALLMAFACSQAHAIGDSGGCGGGPPFGHILTQGAPVELEQKLLPEGFERP